MHVLNYNIILYRLKMKLNTTIRIRADLKFKAKQLGLNLSKVMNDALEARIEIELDKETNRDKIEREIEQKQEEVNQIKTEILMLKEKIELIIKKEEEDEEKRMQEKDDMVIAMKRSGVLNSMIK